MSSTSLQRLLASMLLAAMALPVHAALQGRDLDGEGSTAEAFFDTALGITWTADWNLGATRGDDDDGLMDWQTASDWAHGLDLHGITGWRLPTAVPINNVAYQLAFSNNGSTDRGYAATGIGWGTASEIGHLFYVGLALRGYCAPDDAAPGQQCAAEQVGWTPLPTSDKFFNIQSAYYWTGSGYGPSETAAWGFNMRMGYQNFGDKFRTPAFAVAVHDGDIGSPIAEIPEPSTLALMVAGIAAILGRRRNAGLRSNTMCGEQPARLE